MYNFLVLKESESGFCDARGDSPELAQSWGFWARRVLGANVEFGRLIDFCLQAGVDRQIFSNLTVRGRVLEVCAGYGASVVATKCGLGLDESQIILLDRDPAVFGFLADRFPTSELVEGWVEEYELTDDVSLVAGHHVPGIVVVDVGQKMARLNRPALGLFTTIQEVSSSVNVDDEGFIEGMRGVLFDVGVSLEVLVLSENMNFRSHGWFLANQELLNSRCLPKGQ